jgi:hypothetical protein
MRAGFSMKISQAVDEYNEKRKRGEVLEPSPR